MIKVKCADCPFAVPAVVPQGMLLADVIACHYNPPGPNGFPTMPENSIGCRMHPAFDIDEVYGTKEPEA